MLAALAIDKQDWKEERFTPHPATWLNGAAISTTKTNSIHSKPIGHRGTKMIDPSAHYWSKAQVFVTENQAQWESVSPGTPELDAWVKYSSISASGRECSRLIEYRQIQTIAVPAKFPQWFDPEWSPK